MIGTFPNAFDSAFNVELNLYS
jgi:hypothetical protein